MDADPGAAAAPPDGHDSVTKSVVVLSCALNLLRKQWKEVPTMTEIVLVLVLLLLLLHITK